MIDLDRIARVDLALLHRMVHRTRRRLLLLLPPSLLSLAHPLRTDPPMGLPMDLDLHRTVVVLMEGVVGVEDTEMAPMVKLAIRALPTGATVDMEEVMEDLILWEDWVRIFEVCIFFYLSLRPI